MKLLRFVVNFLCMLILNLLGIYFFISFLILYFIFTGTLIVGEEMYFDSITPSIFSLIIFQLVSLVVFAVCLFIRAKFCGKNDFPLFKGVELED